VTSPGRVEAYKHLITELSVAAFKRLGKILTYARQNGLYASRSASMRSGQKSRISKRLSERSSWRERRRRSHSCTIRQAAATEALRRVDKEAAATNSNSDPANAKAFGKDCLCTITLRSCHESCSGVVQTDAYLPACCTSLAALTGGLMGTKRVSVLVEAGALDARKMASNRNTKISDSMIVLPGLGSSLGI
jgi:hypothetical protein